MSEYEALCGELEDFLEEEHATHLTRRQLSHTEAGDRARQRPETVYFDSEEEFRRNGLDLPGESDLSLEGSRPTSSHVQAEESEPVITKDSKRPDSIYFDVSTQKGSNDQTTPTGEIIFPGVSMFNSHIISTRTCCFQNS